MVAHNAVAGDLCLKNQPGGPNAGNSDYVFEVRLFDNDQKPLSIWPNGGCSTVVDPGGQQQSIDSPLPNPFLVTAGSVDDGAVLFQYGDQSWGNNDQDHHSSFSSHNSFRFGPLEQPFSTN